MITVRDLLVMIDDALSDKTIRLESEVRYIDRNRKDCSFELKWRGIAPGFNKNNEPVDRRFGEGTFHLAQESTLRDAPEQLLISFDW